MKKSDLIKNLKSKFPSLSTEDITASLNVIFEGISNTLSKAGDKVEIRGFGTFSTRTRQARKARNPKTGAAVFKESKSVCHFKASAHLRDLVNKP